MQSCRERGISTLYLFVFRGMEPLPPCRAYHGHVNLEKWTLSLSSLPSNHSGRCTWRTLFLFQGERLKAKVLIFHGLEKIYMTITYLSSPEFNFY